MKDLSSEACQLFYDQQIEKINFDNSHRKGLIDEMAVISKISVVKDFMIFCLKMGVNITPKITDYEINSKLSQTQKVA